VPVPTILCIDDEALGLQIRKAVVERAGYRVLIAVDGPTGLSLFRGNEIDGVVLDYYMPEMDGGVVAQTMRREQVRMGIVQKHGGAHPGQEHGAQFAGRVIRVFLAARTLAQQPGGNRRGQGRAANLRPERNHS
jgi:CheY-like chemotaxis protein